MERLILDSLHRMTNVMWYGIFMFIILSSLHTCETNKKLDKIIEIKSKK